MKKRLQNKIAGSSLTLPTTAVVVTLLWWLPQGGYSQEYLLGWLFCAMTTFVVLETSTQNVLLRIRSRMISSLLLLLMGICGFLHPIQPSTIIQFCIVLSLFFFFRTCESPRPENDTFQSYLLLSLASLLWAPILLLVPAMLWNQGILLRSLQRRSWGASFVGVLTPYALWAVIAFSLDSLPVMHLLPLPAFLQTSGQMQSFVAHAASIISPFTEPFYWQWIVDNAQSMDGTTFWPALSTGLQQRLIGHLPQSLAFLLMLLLALTGFIHYIRQSYDDKSRVRMCHYCYLFLLFVLMCWSVLTPSHVQMLFPLLILVCVPSAAHFITFTNTWFTNAWCIFLFVLSLVVAFVCMAPPSLFQ